jgi:5'-nucleotidase
LVEEEIKREKGGRKYKIVTREYMAQGHDGYLSLAGNKYLISGEEGQLMSAIVRKYLLVSPLRYPIPASDEHFSSQGARFVNRMSRLVGDGDRSQLHSTTWTAISREKARQEMSHKHVVSGSKAAQRWKNAADRVRSTSHGHYRDQLRVSGWEHMSEVDCFDGGKARTGKSGAVALADDDLITVSPVVDSRLKDLARE